MASFSAPIAGVSPFITHSSSLLVPCLLHLQTGDFKNSEILLNTASSQPFGKPSFEAKYIW